MIRSVDMVFGLAVILVFCLSLSSCDKNEPNEPGKFNVIKYDPMEVVKSNNVKTWVHYMPWFESNKTTGNGKWGIHWTMSTKNPDLMDETGRREIASHFYPLTGPYASSDPDIIEYHLLLMKYCGVEGILIDWYGSTDKNDYKDNRENSEAIIDALDEVGLKFAIVYEDRTIAEVAGGLDEYGKIEAAITDMQYIQQNYFSNKNYIKIADKPLLLVFGPEVFHNSDQWNQIMNSFDEQPCFITLNGKSNETKPVSSGEYIWVDNSSLDNKYGNMNKFDVYIGGAYPGFLDFYKEGGWGESFSWSIDHKQGDTFKQNFDRAKTAGVDYLQLITWNDYGEGTMIEPTEEFRYSFLSKIQNFTGVEYDTSYLSGIFDLYTLRKEESSNSENQKILDQAFYYLVSLRSDKAFHLIDSLKIK